MRKSLIILTFLLTSISFMSCSSDNDNQSTTGLEGTWLLQNNTSGSKLIFKNNNFTIDSGTIIIKGTFTLVGNQMSGQVVSRSGSHNTGLQPDTFTGNVTIVSNRVTFTNFSGNWYAVFSSWYGKQ